MRQVVQFQPEITLRLGTKHFIQLAHPSSVWCDLEEFIAEQRLELWRMHLQMNRGLKDFENAHLVVKADASLLLGGLHEFREFLASPFGLDVAGRDNRDECRDAAQSFEQDLRKRIVALQFGVAPDVRLF